MENFPRLVFDEAHSEAWSLSPETARTINPVNPADASYALAAQELVRRGYDVHAHTGGPLTGDVLRPGDVLVIAHPAERGAERVTGSGSPRFSPEELDLVEAFVRGGGGLVVLGECDQDKYGNNLQELLGRFGIAIVSTTVQEGARRHQNVATWVLADIGATVGQGVLAGVAEVCFYRSGVLSLDGAPGAQVLAATSATADPAGQPLAAAVQAGLGRVVAFADSDLFGDDSIEELDHRTLWTNVVTWAAGAATGPDALAATAVSTAADAVELDEHWLALKDAVTRIRPLQSKDGSIDAGTHDLAAARRLVDDITREIAALAPLLPARRRLPRGPRQATCGAGPTSGFGVPGLPRLAAGLPARRTARTASQHLVVFPMYTQNGNPDRNLEARRAARGLARVAGRAGAHPLRQPAVLPDHVRGLHRRLRHQLRGALPRDHRRARGAGALHLGRHLLRPRGRPLPPGHRRRRRSPGPRAARGRRRGWSTTRALRGGLRPVGHGPRPHPQPRRPAVRPVHDQAAPAVLDVRPGGAALRPHRLQGGREAGGRGRPAGP